MPDYILLPYQRSRCLSSYWQCGTPGYPTCSCRTSIHLRLTLLNQRSVPDAPLLTAQDHSLTLRVTQCGALRIWRSRYRFMSFQGAWCMVCGAVQGRGMHLARQRP